MKLKLWLLNFFHFNKQERNGIFILFLIIFGLFFIKLFLPSLVGKNNTIQFIQVNSQNQNPDFTKELEVESLDKNNRSEKSSNKKFVFDPNTISLEEALKLGFSKKIYAILNNYKNKGGHFYKPEDLKKLYGLSPKLYHELESYILIPKVTKGYTSHSTYNSVNEKPAATFQKREHAKPLLDINTADSLSLVYLKGIGPAFTKRILKYRTMLGGFHSMNQLKEVYGMTDSLFIALNTQIILNTNYQKIPINSIDLNTLKKHPYFNFHSAQSLLNYRSKHGLLAEKDIIALGIFNEDKLRLILPYLSYD